MKTTPVITFDNASRIINICWNGECSSDYHYVWLRHQARCPSGLTNDTEIKIDLLPDDPALLSIENLSQTDDSLLIQWQDNQLATRHDLSFLQHAAYDSNSRKQRKHVARLWDASTVEQIPVFDYDSISDDSITFKLLMTIRDYGFAKLKNVPAEPGMVKRIANKFGTVHVNNYGEMFDVKTDVAVDMGSNTGVFLGPHTDEGYRHSPPGISLFHCLQSTQTGGGESILVDGFKAAKIISQMDADAYHALTTYPVFFQRQAIPKEDMQTHARIISTDADGDVTGIRFSDRTLPPQDLPGAHMESLYRAIKLFWNVINSKALMYQYLMQPGDLHIFDNHRVLHGRTAFDPTRCSRHLQQCSVNRDEFHSQLRVLANKAGHPDGDLEMAIGALN